MTTIQISDSYPSLRIQQQELEPQPLSIVDTKTQECFKAVQFENPSNIDLLFNALNNTDNDYEKIASLIPKDEQEKRQLLLSKNSLGFTPLHHAIINNFKDINILKLLFTDEILNILDQHNNSILHYAIMHNVTDIDFLTLLISKTTLLPNTFGNTPLHYALGKGFQDINFLKILVTEKILLVKDLYGNTPLHIAIRNGITDIGFLTMLFSKDNVSIQNNDGDTYLHLALRGEIKDLEFLKLLKTDEILSIKGIKGHTPLHIAFIKKIKDIDFLSFLFSKKNVSIQNDYGDTYLYLAINYGIKDLEFLKLLKIDEVLLTKDIKGNTPLHIALINGILDINILKLLITKDVLLTQNVEGNTPLHIAISKGFKDVDLFKILTESNKKIKERFERSNITFPPPNTLIYKEYQDIDFLKLLITDEVLTIQNCEGQTPLHIAILKEIEDISFLKFLLSKNVINIQDINGATPLISAIIRNFQDIDFLKLLISEEVLTIQAFPARCIPLHIAIINNYYSPDVLRLLISNKALTIQRVDKNTALHAAVYEKITDIDFLKFLISDEALTIRNDQGMTPIFFARSSHNFIALKYFLQICDNNLFVSNYSEIELLKLLANINTLDKLTVRKPIENIIDIELEGGDNSIPYVFFINEILNSPNCPDIIKMHKTQELLNAFNNFLNLATYFPETVFNDIQSNNTTIIEASSYSHSLAFLIYKNYLFTFNKGFKRKTSSITAVEIDRKKITLNIVNRLLDTTISIDEKYDLINQFSKDTFPDNLCKAIEQTAKHKSQKIGNCTWQSFKLLTTLMLALPAIENDLQEKSLDDLIEQFKHEFSTTGKVFSAYCKSEIIKKTKPFAPSEIHELAKEKLKTYLEKHPQVQEALVL